jgi:hypothetical protein
VPGIGGSTALSLIGIGIAVISIKRTPRVANSSDRIYHAAARRFGEILADEGYSIVYGGGAVGSMHKAPWRRTASKAASAASHLCYREATAPQCEIFGVKPSSAASSPGTSSTPASTVMLEPSRPVPIGS